MDETCPEADKLDITKCFSGKSKRSDTSNALLPSLTTRSVKMRNRRRRLLCDHEHDKTSVFCQILHPLTHALESAPCDEQLVALDFFLSLRLAEIPEETVFLSKPHFFGHNASTTNVNFAPDFDKHESAIYFEPMTGTPLLARLRIQTNVNAWIDRIRVHEDGATE